MTWLSIQLPERVKAIAESRAALGHSTLDVYLESLIIADTAEDFIAPEHLQVRSKEHLIAMLDEGAASPASEMKNSDWDAMRRRIMQATSPTKGG